MKLPISSLSASASSPEAGISMSARCSLFYPGTDRGTVSTLSHLCCVPGPDQCLQPARITACARQSSTVYRHSVHEEDISTAIHAQEHRKASVYNFWLNIELGTLFLLSLIHRDLGRDACLKAHASTQTHACCEAHFTGL